MNRPQAPNTSIEGTSSGMLRMPPAAPHVKRWASAVSLSFGHGALRHGLRRRSKECTLSFASAPARRTQPSKSVSGRCRHGYHGLASEAISSAAASPATEFSSASNLGHRAARVRVSVRAGARP